MAVDPEPRWVPAQYKEANMMDLRNLTQGPKGYKERNKRRLEEMEADAAEAPTYMEEDEQPQPSSKRQKADERTYRPVSGKIWKRPGERAGTVMKPKASNNSWEKKMSDKAAKKALSDQKKEALDTLKAKRKAVADQRRAAKERKQANQQKSAVVQKITKASTLKKMMKNKKQKKLLKTADTN